MVTDLVYKPKQFSLSGLNGISDRTLDMHLKLCEGYASSSFFRSTGASFGSYATLEDRLWRLPKCAGLAGQFVIRIHEIGNIAGFVPLLA